ncbi:SLOG family protein, partial [Streptococcus pyogenes]|uniref:SLOG family protein n=1 Tax=Streptococcus pyogenes TaxID=1314 RepID=UPI003DA0D80D
IFLFVTHGDRWNEKNQEVLRQSRAVDFVKYYFPNYEQPAQFSQYYQFLLEKSEGAYVFYDTEIETNLKYFHKKAKD